MTTAIRPAPIDPPEIHDRLWDGFSGTMGWDIGANCGQSLTEMTARFEHVVAFEPAVECLPFLQPWDRPGTVLIKQIALSDTDGEIQLAALPDKIDTGQLVTPDTHGMEWSRSDWKAEDYRAVPSWRIDSLVGDLMPPSFWKLDVEGHELHVLRGAEKTIEDYQPDMLIEFHSADLLRDCARLLIDAGYANIETVRHPHYRPMSELWLSHGWLRVFAP